MPGTRRVPLVRRATAPITPRAMQAFRQLKRLEAECVGPPDCEPHRRCPACDEWWDRQRIIAAELHLQPWRYPAVEREGTGEWSPQPQARALWEQFEEAAASERAVRPPPKRKRRQRRESQAEPVA